MKPADPVGEIILALDDPFPEWLAEIFVSFEANGSGHPHEGVWLHVRLLGHLANGADADEVGMLQNVRGSFPKLRRQATKAFRQQFKDPSGAGWSNK